MNIVDETISQVERLYENVTGKSIKDGEMRHEPVSAEIDPIALLNVRLDHLLQLIESPATQTQLAPINPPLSAWENETHYLLRLEVPGVEKEDIDISLRGNMIVVTGKRKPMSLDKEFQPRWIEFTGGVFQRVINVPVSNINSEINSNLKNGVLEITLPKHVAGSTTKSGSKKDKAQ